MSGLSLHTHLLEYVAVLGIGDLDDAVFCALAGHPSETIQSKIYKPSITTLSQLIQKSNLCSAALNGQ
jgi:hypothetical protein